MNPGEAIIYMLCGFLLLIIISISWFVFRKRKKWAVAVTVLLVIGYVGYYFFLPTLKATIHAVKYEQIIEYLDEKYPGRQFTVRPEHYEDGVYVGHFDVSDKDTPEMGVTLFVNDNGDVTQTSYWNAADYPAQQDLWQTLTLGYHNDYSLDSEKVVITKEDEWIEGELTVFALTINGRPAIAVYEYSPAGYGMLDLQESEAKTYVAAEAEGRTFVYISDQYEEEAVELTLADGSIIEVDATDNKGKLFITE